ncbi:hypothetical protein BIU82_13905 [Arthrobacter sp. SW1]|uniref:DUF5956 family protein n=1 Tax=Arthrobacter sp. SW1 TaxID=1920889 RepID=UPI000877BFBF|nr:DUF5956 family protein [Arthrobacter sp. SW1]OFI39421.1 hypothetical protein BIU82_13905 [Arthrobacter sp. SW1]
MNTDWDEIAFLDSTEGWIGLEDSTWDALISATAGSANVRRIPRLNRELSADDQAVIDEMTDLHLADAQIPLRPHGYAWFIRPTPDFATLEALHEALNRHIDKSTRPATHPAEQRDLLIDFFRESYSRVS